MRWNGAGILVGWAPIAGSVVGYWLLTAEPSWAVWPLFVQLLTVLGALLSIWSGAVFAIITASLLAYTSRQAIRSLWPTPVKI